MKSGELGGKIRNSLTYQPVYWIKMSQAKNARGRLVDSATELFVARGYNAVGVKEICEHAGVTKGSFYHFFSSKIDLALEAIEVRRDYFEQLLERAMSEDRAPLERIRRVFELVADDHSPIVSAGGQMPGCAVGNFALELSGQSEAVRRKVEEVFNSWATYFERALRDAVLAGDLPADIDPGVTAKRILAYFEGVVLLAKTQNDPKLIRNLAGAALLLASPD